MGTSFALFVVTCNADFKSFPVGPWSFARSENDRAGRPW